MPLRRELHKHKLTEYGLDWSKRGGVVGRGILVDYATWAAENGVEYDPMSSYRISLDVVKKILKEKNVTPRAGDILLMRSGWIKWYEEHSQEERLQKISHGSDWIGMEATEESIEWLWDNHFAAIAGDAIGFEVTPLGVCGKYCKCSNHSGVCITLTLNFSNA